VGRMTHFKYVVVRVLPSLNSPASPSPFLEQLYHQFPNFPAHGNHLEFFKEHCCLAPTLRHSGSVGKECMGVFKVPWVTLTCSQAWEPWSHAFWHSVKSYSSASLVGISLRQSSK
jgi:hypothetical protein